MKTKKYSISGNNLNNLIEMLKTKSFITDFKDYYTQTYDKCHVFAFEKYYMRTASSLLITIFVIERKENIYDIDILVGGGGTGVLNLNYWSETSAINKAVEPIRNISKKYNWNIVEKKS